MKSLNERLQKSFSSARKRLLAAAVLAAAAVFPTTAWASDHAVETVYLDSPQHVWWETDTVGKWSSVKKAHEYQVKLYIADQADRDEDDWRSYDPEDESLETVATIRTSETSCDFREYMNDLHTYFFAVRAVPKTSEQAYVVSGSWIASPALDYRGQAVIGLTGGRWRNYLEGSRYENAEGQFLDSGWHLIQGDWYLFDENGYRLSGWQIKDGSRYYLGDDGRMASGWFVCEEQWYYADKDGRIRTGWVMTLPGIYYYLDENGVMLHDTQVDGYWLESDGRCVM